MKTIDIAILTNIRGLGSVNITKIINYCKEHKIKDLKNLLDIDLSKIVSIKISKSINDYLNTDISNLYENMKNILDQYQDDNIKCISIIDDKYPEILKASTNPPVILYCKGNIELLTTNCVATIGTRKNTMLGEKITSKTIEFLVKNNITIVSGLAKGIDTVSHISTLQNNGNTIAILPLIDNIYPASNKKLAEDILNNNGLLISENKPNTSFHSSQLVKRDRIQSGLSKAVFVFETSINGGSMHATNDAIKLNKTIFTPNIYKFSKEYIQLEEVQGIKYLIDNKKSIAYTSDDYPEIINKLSLSFNQGVLL